MRLATFVLSLVPPDELRSWRSANLSLPFSSLEIGEILEGYLRKDAFDPVVADPTAPLTGALLTLCLDWVTLPALLGLVAELGADTGAPGFGAGRQLSPSNPRRSASSGGVTSSVPRLRAAQNSALASENASPA